jgi:hypothetical protein
MSAGKVARRPLWVGIGVAAAVAVVLAFAAVLVLPPFMQVWLYDSRLSGVACEDLPSIEEVEAALLAHADLVRAIESVGEEVLVESTQTCSSAPDRGEITVFYPGGDDREQIEAILEQRNFGVPLALRNA